MQSPEISQRRIPMRSRTRRLGTATILLALWLAGCARSPSGPPFVRAPAPQAGRARLYVYRVDPRPSLSRVRVTIGGLEIGTFSDREYETLELPAGSHMLRAGMRSAVFFAWGWNQQRIRLAPDETVFVELSVRLSERAAPAGRETEIAGRESGVASDNVYIQQRSRPTALETIATTTRLVPH